MKRCHKVKPLAGNILILINDNILEVEPLLHFLDFSQDPRGFVDHVLEIDCLVFFQVSLVFEIAIMADVQEQPSADILRRVVHPVKLIGGISVGFEVGYEALYQCNQLPYVPVFL